MRKICLVIVVSIVGSALGYQMYNLSLLLPLWTMAIILLGTSWGINRAAKKWRTQPWWRDCLIVIGLLCCPLVAGTLVETWGDPNWVLRVGIPWPPIYTQNQLIAPHLPVALETGSHGIFRLVLADLCGWGLTIMALRRWRK